MRELIDQMRQRVERHCPRSHQMTEIPGLSLFRTLQSSNPCHVVYNPRLLVVLQGSKTVALNGLSFEARPGKVLMVTVDLPVVSQIHAASNSKPHVAITLDLDRDVLAAVLQQAGPRPALSTDLAGLVEAGYTSEMVDPLSRLLALLDQPGNISFLYPLILSELYFRLLQGPLGNSLVQYALNDSHGSQIRKVTEWIKSHYAEPMSIETLAEMAGMSITSFHRHFKNVTLMTPLQYRTQFRLQQARQMLIADGRGAGVVGLQVGYESQSQFSRDYKRMFGAPPGMDTAKLAGLGPSSVD